MRFSVENSIFTVYTNVKSFGSNPTYLIVNSSAGLTVLIIHLGIHRSPRIKIYLDYKSYNPDSLTHDKVTKVLPHLPHKLSYSSFQEPITCILKKHLPIKKKYVRANDGAFMTKELRKAIMHRSNARRTLDKFA